MELIVPMTNSIGTRQTRRTHQRKGLRINQKQDLPSRLGCFVVAVFFTFFYISSSDRELRNRFPPSKRFTTYKAKKDDKNGSPGRICQHYFAQNRE